MKKERLTIYDIARLTESTSPHFFTRKTLKFFHQTMGKFSMKKQKDGRIYISQPMTDHNGRKVGLTERYFNPVTNELERVEK